MSVSVRNRNIIIGATVAFVTIALLAFFLSRGDEESESTTVTTSSTPRVVTTSTATQEDGAGVEILSEDVSPDEVGEGDAVSFTVSVRGNASKVILTDELGPASAGGDFTPVFTEKMVEGSTSGGITTWTLDATASDPGRHRFYATATASDGSKVVMPGEAPTYVVDAAG